MSGLLTASGIAGPAFCSIWARSPQVSACCSMRPAMAVSPRLDVALLDEAGDLAIHRLASHFAVV